MTALSVALVELCGGFLFTFGIASRLTSLILFVNMTMAYLSVPDDRVNFSHIFSKPDDFYGASPYTYWFAALLILILGPGLFAVDTLLKRGPPHTVSPRTGSRNRPALSSLDSSSVDARDHAHCLHAYLARFRGRRTAGRCTG